MGNFFSNADNQGGRPVGLSPQQAFEYLEKGIAIVDIRPEYETNFRVIDADYVFLLPFKYYRERYQEVPKEKPLIIIDSIGMKSPEAARFFIEQGYEDVAYIIGGVISWEKSGFPITKDLDYELNGGCACRLRPKKST